LPDPARPSHCRTLAPDRHKTDHGRLAARLRPGGLMSQLNTQSQFISPDEFYEQLIDAHRDLSLEQSHAMNAALVLLLSNHIGDLDVVAQALAQARATVQPAH